MSEVCPWCGTQPCQHLEDELAERFRQNPYEAVALIKQINDLVERAENAEEKLEEIQQLRDDLRAARINTPEAFYTWVNSLREEIERAITVILETKKRI